jgi:hypothetical protein
MDAFAENRDLVTGRARSGPAASTPLLLSLNLDRVRSDNCEQQTPVACVYLCVARGNTHLNPVAFATDQSSLAKNAHVLWQSGFRNGASAWIRASPLVHVIALHVLSASPL